MFYEISCIIFDTFSLSFRIRFQKYQFLLKSLYTAKVHFYKMYHIKMISLKQMHDGMIYYVMT